MACVLACMGRTVTVALVCLLAVGAAVAGGVGGGPGEGAQPAAASGDAAAENGERRGTIASEQVSVEADDSGVDVGASLDWGGIALETDGDGGGEGTVSHGAIDGEMADAGRSGACAVGFGEEDSPLDLAFDGGNDSFGLAWSGNATDGESGGESDSMDAGEVVEECSSSDGG